MYDTYVLMNKINHDIFNLIILVYYAYDMFILEKIISKSKDAKIS